MPQNRRSFLKKIGLTGGGLLPTAQSFSSSNLDLKILEMLSTESVEPDGNEDFWSWVQQSYRQSANIVNLNNAGVSPQPQVVEDAFFKYTRLSNEAPSLYMQHTLNRSRQFIREKIAKFAGVNPDTIVINRNATEALNTIILGLPLKKGDEIILSKYDYPNMYGAWQQREKKDAVILKIRRFSYAL